MTDRDPRLSEAEPGDPAEPESIGAGIAVAVSVCAPGWRRLDGDPAALCRAAVLAGLAGQRTGPAEVSVLLGDDALVRRLNARWRDEDAPTDVLSFPQPPLPAMTGDRTAAPHAPLGDVVLAFETVAAAAARAGRRLDHHVCHLIVHGCLHLLGHDHADAGETRRMRALERAALARLGIADPYRPEGGDGACGKDGRRKDGHGQDGE